ncbi:hypothetical protein M0R45_027937 [Rubus argutus]|uniref:At1g61320/AtMIF1 LRR domain-containing protein n=1 Tax=Rubus argutus TaxID=59490 RepID=A0AAW1W5Q2_RUBAR
MLNINLVDYRGLVIPTFANLKHLELIIEDDCYRARRNLISFLKASPYLQRLVLKLEPCMEYPNCWKILKIGGAHCPHYYIKVVEIAGFWPSTSVKHVMYLIKNAVALEKIVIKPLQKWYWGGNRKEREEVEARDQALQQLKGMVPSNIEFVCI